MAELTQREIARRAARIYDRFGKDQRGGRLLTELSGIRFGEMPGGRAAQALKDEGLTLKQFGQFLDSWSQYEQSQGREFSPTTMSGGGQFLTSQSNLNEFIQSLPASTREPGRRGGQGMRPDDAAVAAGRAASQDMLRPSQPPTYSAPTFQPQYEQYLNTMKAANETRSALGMEPLPIQSMEQLNVGQPTIANVTGAGQSRILPTPTVQRDGLGYFGDMMAGPQPAGATAQPSRGALNAQGQRTGAQLPAGVVTPTPQAQVGQAVTSSPQYQQALENMIGQAPSPAGVNAPPVTAVSPRVTSPMAGVGGPTGVASGVDGGAGVRAGVQGATATQQGPQNIFAVESQSPQAYRDEREARIAAMRQAMQSGQPMVLTGQNLFVGSQASQVAPGAELSATAPTFTGGQRQAPPQQMMFNPTTGRYEPNQRGFQQGLSYRAGYNVGAGDPEANRARYMQDLANMQRVSELSDATSFAGRQRAREAEKRQSEAEARAAREGKLTPQQQMAEAERERQSKERIAGMGAEARGGVRPAELTQEQQTSQSNYARSFAGLATTQTQTLTDQLNPNKNPDYKSLSDEDKRSIQQAIDVFKSEDFKVFAKDISTMLATDAEQRQQFTDAMNNLKTPSEKATYVLDLFRQFQARTRPEGF